MGDEIPVLERHRRAVTGFDAAVDRAAGDPASWAKSSPCDGWTAADVVVHVAGVHHRLATQLGESCELPDAGEPDEITAKWRGVRDATLRALAGPGALDRDVVMGVGPMKVGQFANILMTDTLVHTWDLARAIGADERLDPDLVRRAHEAALPLEDLVRSGTAFGPKVEIDPGADSQSQMLAFFGRDPR